jgi:hypothetical protein
VRESASKQQAFRFDIGTEVAKTSTANSTRESKVFEPDLHIKQPSGSQVIYRLVCNRAVSLLNGTAVLLGDVGCAHSATQHLQRGLRRMTECFFAARPKLDRGLLWEVTGYESLDPGGEIGTALIVSPSGNRALAPRAIDEICNGIADGILAVESAAHRRLVQKSVLDPGEVSDPPWLLADAVDDVVAHWSKAVKDIAIRHGRGELVELNVPAPERAEPLLLESFELTGAVDLVGRSDLAVRLIGIVKSDGSDDEERRTVKGNLARQDLLDAAVKALAQQSRVTARVGVYSSNKAIIEDLREV